MTTIAQADETQQNSSDLEALLSRQSYGILRDPAPSNSDLNLIFDAALRAPDHGRLRPWSFLVICGAAREAFVELMIESIKRRSGPGQEAAIKKTRERIGTMPLIVAAGAKIKTDSPIPEIEQLLSTGAATMNVLNAAHALGYGAKWVTPGPVYDRDFNAALGFTWPDRLVGILFIGTKPQEPMPVTPRPARADHVREWLGVEG
jgi:nitroreductase